MARPLVVICVGVGVLIGSGPVAAASAPTPTLSSPSTDPTVSLGNGNGITVDASHWVDPRLLDITVSTPALPAPAGVRVLLPASYSADPSLHYPVLYLLHGGNGRYTDWTAAGHAESLTADLPLIVVMPDGGGGGWYSNWDNGGQGGPPEWETFHINELIPWIDANFRTVADCHGRAIAGPSMGGYGALSYAARHPNLFEAAASFSGAVDSNNLGLRFLIQLSPLVENGGLGAIFGSSLFDGAVPESHNPYTLAANLREMHVALYTGNGVPGPLDPPGTPFYDYNEFTVHEMSVALDHRLTRLGIAHTFDNYGNGTHTFVYWNRDLAEELPATMAALAAPTTSGTVPPGAAGTDVDAKSASTALAPPTIDPPVIQPDPTAPPGITLSVSTHGVDNPYCSAGSPCRTISHAVSIAGAGDTIAVGPGTFPENLTIGAQLTIQGTTGRTVVEGSARSTEPTVAIQPGATVTLRGLRIRNPNLYGDGVRNLGTATIEDTVLSHNGGAGFNNVAGTATVENSVARDNGTSGIQNGGTITIDHTVIDGNDYGFSTNTTATITDSTVSDNVSAGVLNGFGAMQVDRTTIRGNGGVGVQAYSGATTVTDSTVVDNRFHGVATSPTPYGAAPVIDLIDSTVTGNVPDGLNGNTPITAAGTIVSGNSAADCTGSVSDAGYNLAGDGACAFSATGSRNSTAPHLGALRDNGGPTFTAAPAPTGPAVDAVPTGAVATIGGRNVALCTGTTDQRGVSRPQPTPPSTCDIGAVEMAASSTTLTVASRSAGGASRTTLVAWITAGPGLSGLPRPRGTVAFMIGADPIAGCTSIPVARSGRARCTTTLPHGSGGLTATYVSTDGYHLSAGSTTYASRPPKVSCGHAAGRRRPAHC